MRRAVIYQTARLIEQIVPITNRAWYYGVVLSVVLVPFYGPVMLVGVLFCGLALSVYTVMGWLASGVRVWIQPSDFRPACDLRVVVDDD